MGYNPMLEKNRENQTFDKKAVPGYETVGVRSRGLYAEATILGCSHHDSGVAPVFDRDLRRDASATFKQRRKTGLPSSA